MPSSVTLSRFSTWWIIQVELRLQYFGPVFPKRWYHRAGQRFGWFLHDMRRRLQGARDAPLGDTSGSINDDGIQIEFGGCCPVQGDGVVDGRICYYRSRGNGWQFSVAPADADPNDDMAALAYDAWEHFEDPYICPDGGYIERAVSERCIRKAVAAWRAAGRP